MVLYVNKHIYTSISLAVEYIEGRVGGTRGGAPSIWAGLKHGTDSAQDATSKS